MGACRIVNESVAQAVEAIANISSKYQAAGAEFISSLNAAIAEMEGDTKDALKQYIDTDVNQFVATDLPNAVIGMSELLEGNRSNFESVDAQLAASIRGDQ